MNFRQRLAWILTLIYLTCGCYTIYYTFDRKSGYGEVIMQNGDAAPNRYPSSVQWIARVYDVIPSHVWFISGVILYLIFFIVLLTLTAANPVELFNHFIGTINIFKQSKPHLQPVNGIRMT
ncbi:Transmembrane protein 251 [Trichoplax sp. H2]|nr:Transmembrane protein 251 [Trichoplax sp. H2]|eukprot:RDD44832.1 Transmembrane protein 251 [Trichoplax sp. H2]